MIWYSHWWTATITHIWIIKMTMAEKMDTIVYEIIPNVYIRVYVYILSRRSYYYIVVDQINRFVVDGIQQISGFQWNTQRSCWCWSDAILCCPKKHRCSWLQMNNLMSSKWSRNFIPSRFTPCLAMSRSSSTIWQKISISVCRYTSIYTFYYIRYTYLLALWENICRYITLTPITETFSII